MVTPEVFVGITKPIPEREQLHHRKLVKVLVRPIEGGFSEGGLAGSTFWRMRLTLLI
jgi:hypothetical protein